MYLSIIFLLFGLFLGTSLLSQASGLEEIVNFEKRLSVQLTNNSNNSNFANDANFTNNSNFANDATLLDKPRNSTMEQIKSNNQTVNQLFNNSIQTMGEGSEKTRQNISEILSLLK